MTLVSEIRSRLVRAFPENQADLLAEVLVESHAELVNRADFHKLTEVVQDLAEAQKRTEERVGDMQGSLQEMQRAVTDLAKQVGGLSNTVGANLEDFACDLVPELLEKYWRFVTVSAGPEELTTADGVGREFDVVVRGTIDGRPVTVLCETKATVSTTEVSKFLRIVEKVREAYPGEDIRPLFFGYKANSAARGLITQSHAAMIFTRGVMIPVAA
jgi:hypothetical protein